MAMNSIICILNRKLGLALLCLSVFVPALATVEVSVTGEWIPPTPQTEISVPFPFMARHLGKGYAEVLFVVDKQGIPGDFVILKDTNPVFSQAIINTISKVRYEPAMVNGEAVPSRVIFKDYFHFQLGAAVVHATDKRPSSTSDLEQMATDRVHSPDELDQPLTAVEKTAPEYPEALLEISLGGGVLVEFYVAKDGSVKAPIVISSSHEMFSESALRAMGNWKFNAPKISGKPVTVVARQQFSFGTE